MRTTEFKNTLNSHSDFFTKNKTIKAKYYTAFNLLFLSDCKIIKEYAGEWANKGRNFKSNAIYTNLWQLCNIFKIAYTCYNDAPRNGRNGNYIYIDCRQLHNVRRYLANHTITSLIA